MAIRLRSIVRAPVVASVTTVLAALLVAAPATGQVMQVNEGPLNEGAASGWTFTPGVAVGSTWDNNVLFRGRGDDNPNDLLNLVNGHANLDFTGRLGRLSASYNGAFTAFRQLNELNTYDQRAMVSARRRVTPRVTLSGGASATWVPSTEQLALVGVPFVRVGARIEEARGRVEASLSKYTQVSAAFNLVWVEFDETELFTGALRGGRGQGGMFGLRRQVGGRTAITADYDLQFSKISNDTDTFAVQTAWGGIEYQLSERLRFAAGFGASHLAVSELAPSRTGPALRAGLSHNLRRTGLDIGYSRSFVPSYGFGGTQQNEEVTGRLRVVLWRRASARGSVSWNSNESLDLSDLRLRSTQMDATFSYALHRRLQLETFYTAAHQRIDRPGGQADRHRIGVQVVTGYPLRIR
jgi:hypothetical protein